MQKNKPCRIDHKRLVTLFKDIKRLKSEETRFCFLLGAGASKSSGIKTGWELANEWYNSLKEDLSLDELKQWEVSVKFDSDDIGSYYPHLYRKRYETSAQIGYEEFKKLMENIDPGLGYVILSQIISNEKHNFVITTNFDYLIEDSVRMYTPKKPFSAGHETLAEFISSQTERPTIIKVHRDLFLHPFNDESETEKLKEEWKNALSPILRNFNLLVIGYGGNDGSLMDYLNSIESKDRKAIYWCYRNDNEINSKINTLLKEKDYLVKIKGFDELMIKLNDALEYTIFDQLNEPDEHPFVKAAKDRLSNLNKKLLDMLGDLSKDSQDIDDETKELYSGVMKYLYDAYFEKDEKKKDKIYTQALLEYHDNSDLLGQYAFFLCETLKDYDKAEEYYKRAIELDRSGTININNYANFLKNIRKDYNKAEELYKRAFELDPNDADYIGSYALFLNTIRKEYDKAEEFFKKAIELNPNDAVNIGNYALFLVDIRKDFEKAEELYKRAIELDPNGAIYIGNYANFLHDIRKEYEKAEEFYKRAIKKDPNIAANIGNYANFLKVIRKEYDKAEEFYKRAIELDPNGDVNMGNYALFLVDIRKDYDKAEAFYKRAIEIEPNGVANIGKYALFLQGIRKEYDKAEEYYKRAIELDPNDAINFGNYAVFLYDIKRDYENAEKLYKKAIVLNPNDANNIGNYANFLKVIRKDYDKSEEFYKRAIEIDPNGINHIGNYANFLCDIRKDYDEAEEFYKRAIKLNPKDANNLSNYAHCLIISKSDFGKANKMIADAFIILGKNNAPKELLTELWFYRYAHYKNWYKKAESTLEELISDGARSLGWDFSEHIEIAKRNKHPNIKKLIEFSDLISK